MGYTFKTQVVADWNFLTVHWDQETGCVVMEWKQFAWGERFRQGLDRGLSLLQERGTSLWLADTLRLGPLTAEDKEWVDSDWFPRAVAGGVKKMAIVTPERAVARMSVDSVMAAALSKIADEEFTVQYFMDAAAARLWLQRLTMHHPSLGAAGSHAPSR
jgi:hypothetical protein